MKMKILRESECSQVLYVGIAKNNGV